MQLTNDTSRLLAALYGTYLDRRKCGYSREKAKKFEPGFHQHISALSEWIDDDVYDCLSELNKIKFIKMNVIGGFTLEDTLIAYMESRFKSGMSDIAKYLADLAGGIVSGLII